MLPKLVGSEHDAQRELSQLWQVLNHSAALAHPTLLAAGASSGGVCLTMHSLGQLWSWIAQPQGGILCHLALTMSDRHQACQLQQGCASCVIPICHSCRSLPQSQWDKPADVNLLPESLTAAPDQINLPDNIYDDVFAGSGLNLDTCSPAALARCTLLALMM